MIWKVGICSTDSTSAHISLSRTEMSWLVGGRLQQSHPLQS